MVEHGSKHLAACYEQTDAINGGTAKSFLILAERGMPQEHPFLETQLEIMNRHQELLAEEQAIVVNDSTTMSAISLLEQASALEQLKVCLAGTEGGDAGAWGWRRSGLGGLAFVGGGGRGHGRATELGARERRWPVGTRRRRSPKDAGDGARA